MKVKIKKLNNNAVTPRKYYGKDFCYDVVATSCEEVAPNVYRYGTGLSFEIVRSGELLMDDGRKYCLSIDMRPRSSVWKTGMVLSNCVGTIDEDYRGEVSAVFYHVMPDMPKYEVGDRIGQIKLGFTEVIQFVETDELSNDVERGDKGYGSSGK